MRQGGEMTPEREFVVGSIGVCAESVLLTEVEGQPFGRQNATRPYRDS